MQGSKHTPRKPQGYRGTAIFEHIDVRLVIASDQVRESQAMLSDIIVDISSLKESWHRKRTKFPYRSMRRIKAVQYPLLSDFLAKAAGNMSNILLAKSKAKLWWCITPINAIERGRKRRAVVTLKRPDSGCIEELLDQLNWTNEHVNRALENQLGTSSRMHSGDEEAHQPVMRERRSRRGRKAGGNTQRLDGNGVCVVQGDSILENRPMYLYSCIIRHALPSVLLHRPRRASSFLPRTHPS
ncbi:uncharacterized protein ATNIH1004_004556 [Aspergillus tanneri]|uniref:Uncharacterized protein n=1 Tax=Aspergillus tanneri TaxID=1220188 RepID=A0A5M9MNP4_9EURO|nr:uncharacterized protein ATNIH1004_004556 [Aspergillus tanneri]KAA8648671.1 hypothetical protein ATNIH1004_004556 [Aspergillus tanneri]